MWRKSIESQTSINACLTRIKSLVLIVYYLEMGADMACQKYTYNARLFGVGCTYCA